MGNAQTREIKLFHERIERLKLNSDFFVSINFKLSYKDGLGEKTALSGPDLKTIKAFVLDFRPFIANDEPVNFFKVCNIIEKSKTDVDLIKKLREARDAWSKLLEKKERIPMGGLRLKIDSEDLLSEKNLNLWINGEYFHLDEEKKMFLEKIQGTPFELVSKFVFIDLLQRLSGVLFWFDKEVISKLD
jgi:hypothetical protein